MAQQRQRQRFLVAPYQSGLQRDRRAWLISNDAFTRLRNAYIYRGRVRKRFGERPLEENVDDPQLNTRLRFQVGTTANTGDISVIVPDVIFKIGQQLSIGGETFTLRQFGAPAPLIRTNNFNDVATLNTDPNDADYRRLNIQNAAGSTPVYFYPAEPVMGIYQYEQQTINDEVSMIFDTQFAYQFSGPGFDRLGTGADATWTSTDFSFFSGTNFRSDVAFGTTFIVVNNDPNDNIRSWDGATWTRQVPQYGANANQQIKTARVVVSFRNRLLLFNTVEADTGGADHRYVNRVRFSVFGGPFVTDAWREDIPGKGGALDAPTKEAIISVGYVQDRLIVYFERSTYELAYTQNQQAPFLWRQINSVLGVSSTFSAISLEQNIVGIGQTGIHSCNGGYVERIDKRIPDEVFKIRNLQNGRERIYGIRDFQNAHLYWTLPFSENTRYPDTILAYDYDQDSWAFFDDTITCFGDLFTLTENTTNDETWAEDQTTWLEDNTRWRDSTNVPGRRGLVAGNQQGYVFFIDPDWNSNTEALSITNMTDPQGNGVIQITMIGHNLQVDDYIYITKAIVRNNGVREEANINGRIVRVNDVINDDTIEVIEGNNALQVQNNYKGKGMATRVSPVSLETKDFNFFIDSGKDMYVSQIDFYVDRTPSGELRVEYGTGTADLPLYNATVGFGDNKLDTFGYNAYENQKEQVWHPLYVQADGELVNVAVFHDDQQIRDPDIAFANFQLHAMLFYAEPSVRVLQ